MILLKIMTKNDKITFLESKDADDFSISGKKYELNIEGKIEFLNLQNKWYVRNNSETKIKCGLFSLKPHCSRRFKVGTKLSINGTSIERVKLLKKYKGINTITAGNVNSSFDMTKVSECIIGRDPSCNIIVNNPQVDLKNTRVVYSEGKCYVEDLKSANGLIINDKRMKSKQLEDYDVIEIPGAFFTYFKGKLIYSTSKRGIRIDVVNLSKVVRDNRSRKPITLLSNLNFTIKEGEFVAIVGGSGAGKSTTLDAINGQRPATGGNVYYDYNNFYDLKECYQKIVGYVPQQDIMHEDLTVIKTLYYYAQIRMQHHLSKQEVLEICDKALEDVSLLEKKNLKVSKLSGGQKKRVSIAMELLSNPKVIFLDEPTSGLSPDLDYDIMELLQKLAHKQGKTIIVITHNMENVDRCDKIAFLGNGGKLCYFGTPDKLFTYFKTKKFGKIFSMLTDKENVDKFAEKLNTIPEYCELIEEQNRLFKEAKYVSNEEN